MAALERRYRGERRRRTPAGRSSTSWPSARARRAAARACGPESLGLTIAGRIHRRRGAPQRPRRRAGLRRAVALGARADHRAARPQGDPRAPGLPRQRRPRLPDARPAGGDPVGRRGAAHPAGHADRLEPDGRALHPRRAVASGCTSATTARLLDTLKRLRDLGNTVLVVEHDEETIRAADFVDRPGARGRRAGRARGRHGHPGRDRRQPGVAHRALPRPGRGDPAARRHGARATGDSSPSASRASTTSRA